MENEEPRPVKSINRRCLEIKPYNCLIWGKRAGKENLRSPEEKGISAFVTALGTRGACNNFDKSANDDAFDFNNNTLKNNEVSIKWHPSCNLWWPIAAIEKKRSNREKTFIIKKKILESTQIFQSQKKKL